MLSSMGGVVVPVYYLEKQMNTKNGSRIVSFWRLVGKGRSGLRLRNLSFVVWINEMGPHASLTAYPS